MPEFQTSPGMRDILAPESARWRALAGVFAEVVDLAGYELVIPPLMEDLGVFTRIVNFSTRRSSREFVVTMVPS